MNWRSVYIIINLKHRCLLPLDLGFNLYLAVIRIIVMFVLRSKIEVISEEGGGKKTEIEILKDGHDTEKYQKEDKLLLNENSFWERVLNY